MLQSLLEGRVSSLHVGDEWLNKFGGNLERNLREGNKLAEKLFGGRGEFVHPPDFYDKIRVSFITSLHSRMWMYVQNDLVPAMIREKKFVNMKPDLPSRRETYVKPDFEAVRLYGCLVSLRRVTSPGPVFVFSLRILSLCGPSVLCLCGTMSRSLLCCVLQVGYGCGAPLRRLAETENYLCFRGTSPSLGQNKLKTGYVDVSHIYNQNNQVGGYIDCKVERLKHISSLLLHLHPNMEERSRSTGFPAWRRHNDGCHSLRPVWIHSVTAIQQHKKSSFDDMVLENVWTGEVTYSEYTDVSPLECINALYEVDFSRAATASAPADAFFLEAESAEIAETYLRGPVSYFTALPAALNRYAIFALDYAEWCA